MIVKREKATIHVFNKFQFVPGTNIVPDSIGRQIMANRRFQEQIDLGFMVVVEPPAEETEAGNAEDVSTLAEVLKSKNARDAKALIKETLDIVALRGVLESGENRQSVLSAVEEQIAILTEGRNDETDETAKDE